MPDNAQYVDNELDRRIKQFDSSWRSGDIPSIADQLECNESRELDAGQRRELLTELVMIDLEYHWRHAAKPVSCDRGGTKLAEGTQRPIPEQPRLDDYLAAYPELGPLERFSTELIASEYRTRHRWGDRPTHREYVLRFPHREAAVRRALERVDARLPRSSKPDGLRVRCPHCHDSIAVDDRDLGGNFTCSSCARRFSLVDEGRCVAQSGEVQRVGSIELVQRLGSGSFGTVWKSRDTKLDRMVAVKLPHQGTFDATRREQFMREARAAAQLKHPNIVSILEVGRHEDRIYIVTDLVQGVTLADWLTERRPTPRDAAELCAKLADALEHAHQQGVIHRDLKPSNIMMDTDSEPHLMDFGLAKREAGEVTMTIEGKLLGTPAYMPPEQARGSAHEADCRSDIYSLGVILFELLTGERPFGGSTEVLLQRIMLEDATSTRRFSHTIPQDLDTICLKCLDKDRKRRYQTATELREELQRFLHGEPVRARPITRAARTWRWCKRNPVIATLGATVASLLLFLAFAGPLVAFSRARLATREVAARKDIRRQLYAADMNVALHAWEAANVGRVLALLAQHRPLTGQEELRRFEWYHLWRAAHRHLMVFDHDASIYSAAFSRDGKKLYTGGWDATIKVWNINTGKLLGTLNDHSNTVTSLTLSPDGTTLVSSSVDGTIRFWQGEPLKQIDIFSVDDDGVTALAFSPDGGRLATGHISGKVILRDVSSRQTIESQNEHTGYILSVAFSPDGKTLASSAVNDHNIQLWNIETDQWTRLEGGHTGMVSSLAFSPSRDGTILASGSRDGRVVLWDLASGEPEETIPSHESGVKSLTFSSDGKMLASAGISGDASAKIWDLSTYKKKLTLKGHAAGIFAVVFSPTNNTLVTGSYDGTAKLWDVSSQRERSILREHSDNVRDLAFSPKSETLVSGSSDGSVRIWDVQSGEVIDTLEVAGAEVWSVALSADGKTLASGDSAGKVTLWDFAAGNERTTFEKHTAHVLDVAFSPNGRMMASCGKDDRVRLWDVKTGSDRHTFLGSSGTREFGAVAFSPSGRILVFGGAHGEVQLWDVKTGEELCTLRGHEDGIRSVTFSPDGRLLAAGADDTTAIVWNVSTGAEQQRFTGHSGPVHCVEFFADGKTLISGGVDRSVRLWDMATGRERFRFDHGEWVLSAAISPNGQVLASAGLDNMVKLWRAATEQEVQAAGEWWNR